MAAGDLITADYQYEYRGLLFGSMTPYIVDRVQGLLGMPDVSSDDEDRQDADGYHPDESPSYDGREIDVDLYVVSEDPIVMEQRLDAMRATFRKNGTFEPLVFQRPGSGKRRIYVRTMRRSIDSNYEVAHGLGEAAIVLTAADPLIYSDTEQSVQFNVESVNASGQGIVNNAGTEPTFPVVTLTGAIDDPVVTNANDDNRSVNLDITTNAGDVLVIDFLTRNITLNGNPIMGSLLRAESQWWHLLPDDNTVHVSRTGTGTTVTVAVDYRHAWA